MQLDQLTRRDFVALLGSGQENVWRVGPSITHGAAAQALRELTGRCWYMLWG